MPLLLRCTSLIPRKKSALFHSGHTGLQEVGVSSRVSIQNCRGLYRPTVPVWSNWFFQDPMALYINALMVSLSLHLHTTVLLPCHLEPWKSNDKQDR